MMKRYSDLAIIMGLLAANPVPAMILTENPGAPLPAGEPDWLGAHSNLRNYPEESDGESGNNGAVFPSSTGLTRFAAAEYIPTPSWISSSGDYLLFTQGARLHGGAIHPGIYAHDFIISAGRTEFSLSSVKANTSADAIALSEPDFVEIFGIGCMALVSSLCLPKRKPA